MKSQFRRRLTALALVLAMLMLLPANVSLAEQTGVAEIQDPESETITLSKEEAELFRMLAGVRELIDEYHIKDIDKNKFYEGLLKGMLESLGDRYSQYLTEDQLDALSSELEGEFGGIGVTIELIDASITVVSTFSGSPAEKAGIQPGDIFVSAGGKDLRGKLPQDAAEILRGEPGTEVDAILLRPSTGVLIPVRMVRALIVPPTFDLEDLGDGLFYLQISQFTETVGTNVPVLIATLKEAAGLKGIVLDLRNNPGGYLDACVHIAEELVPMGPIVELRRKELKEVITNDKDITPVPVVVLVNKGSASASEILAAALRDRGVGIIVGETTFGKGSVQTIVSLGEGKGGVKLSIAEYFTPSGKSLQGQGLAPDMEVKAEVIDIPAKPESMRVISRGTVGLDVLAVQECLTFLGYDVGELDGIYGPKTEGALRTFARSRDIVFTGNEHETFMDMLYASVLQKAKDSGDAVRAKGIELLKNKINTGTWQ